MLSHLGRSLHQVCVVLSNGQKLNGGEFVALNFFYYSMVLTTIQLLPIYLNKIKSQSDVIAILLKLVSSPSVMHLPLLYWPHAFQTASYLINRQPTSILHNISLFKALFGQKSNYLKLKKFGCLCYPLTWPYNTHILELKSVPYIFLGYSQTQNAYKCYDPQAQ